MNKIGVILSMSLLALVLIGCGADRTREEKVSAMLNKIDDPFFVVSTNVQDLMDKSGVMKEGTIPFTYYQVLSFFLDVELTGIDYATEAQVVIGEGESFVPNFYGIFKVGDKELFTKLLEVEANAEIKEKEGMHYVIKDSEQYCIVWDEEFAIASSIPMDFAAMLSGNSGNQGEKMIDKNIEIIKAAEDGDVDVAWVDFLSNDADIAMRYDGEGFYNYMELMAMGEKEELETMKEIYEGMNCDIFVGFNNGSVDFEIVSDLSDDLREKLNFMGDGGVDASLFNFGKSNNPLLSGTYNVDVEGVLDYIEGMSEEVYEGMVEGTERIGLSLEDIQAALSGQMVYMIDEVIEKDEIIDFGYGDPIVMAKTEPNFAFVLGVSDMNYIQNTFEAMMVASAEDELMADMSEIELMENGVINMGDAFIYLGKDILFASNDLEWANKIAENLGVKVDNPGEILTSNPFTLYSNVSKLVGLKSMKHLDGYLKLVESVSSSANIDGGTFKITMSDENENSLLVLTETMGALMADFEKVSNPDMERELENAVEETVDAFEKLEDIDMEEVEEGINDAIDNLNH